MKTYTNTIIRSCFLLSVLFCFSIHTYSGYSYWASDFEFSSVENSAGGNFIPDNDPLCDDQIIHTNEMCWLAKPGNLLLILHTSPPVYNVFLSVWHPPKIS
jgi:hypothetical protein